MRWKWILAICICFIIALMVAGYAFLRTYDYSKLKPRIERIVRETTGRKLNLSGEINLAIGFSPVLVVTDITFANAEWGSQPQMVQIDELRAQIRLLPLLFRNLELRHFALTGVDILLETSPGGLGNWEFPARATSTSGAGTFATTKTDADDIRFKNLDLTFRNGKTGSITRFNLADFKMAKQGPADGLAVDLRAEVKGQPLILSGKTGLISELLESRRFPLDLSGTFSDAAIRLQGAIDDVLKLRGINLEIQTSGINLAQFRLIDPIRFPETSTFDLQGHLLGSMEALSLNGISGSLFGKEADLAFSGKVDDLITVNGIDLQIKGSGKDLTKIGALIDQKLPPTDEFSLEGRLTGSAKALKLLDAQGRARRGALRMAADGGIEDLITLKGLDLNVQASGNNLAALGEIIEQKLPDSDEFSIQGRLTGTAKDLSLKAARGSAKRGSIKVAIRGGVMDLIAFSGLDLSVNSSGKNLAEVGTIIDQKLPPTDQFAVEGRLTGSAKTVSVSNASGSVRRGSLNLAVNGKIKDLLAFSGVDLNLKGSGKNLAEIGTIIEYKLPATDQFTVQGRLTGSAKTLSLKEAQASARKGSLIMSISGGIKGLPALKGLKFKVNVSGKELAEIGSLVGTHLPDLGPFDLSTTFLGSAKTITLNPFSLIVDQSDFNGLAMVDFLKRPKITLRLESSVIDFTALMKSLERDRQKDGQNVVKKDRQKQRLFSDDPLPFDVLNKVDADIVLKAKNIHARDARLKFGQLTAMLEEGDLNIEKLEAVYQQTKISGNLNINSGSPPQVTTSFLVQDLDLGNLLKETGVNDQVRAHLDIAAHGKSNGNSVQGLMAGLDGSFGVVMGKGYLTNYLNLISLNLTDKVREVWGRHKEGDQIKCAVVLFDIQKGIADSQAFVFDTQAGILQGKGEINLGTEEVNFLLVPKPRHPTLSFMTKLRVTGTIMDAKVRPDSLALLAEGSKLLSTLAIGPLGLLAPFIRLGAHEKHPCEIKRLDELGLSVPAKK